MQGILFQSAAINHDIAVPSVWRNEEGSWRVRQLAFLLVSDGTNLEGLDEVSLFPQAPGVGFPRVGKTRQSSSGPVMASERLYGHYHTLGGKTFPLN